MASPRFTFAIMLGSVGLAVGACAGGTAEPASLPTAGASASEAEPSGAPDATESPTPFPSPFPVAAFAEISEDPVGDDLAATLQAILDEAAIALDDVTAAR